MDHQPEIKAIEIIERCSASPPPNEQATGYWVIVPVLEALGYERVEILPQATDSAGQRPDYEILPGTDHSWYLETKTWSTTLHDSHVNQALNYANQNGRRWVVLSNGREWHLYDNTVQSDARGKLVSSGALTDPDSLRSVLEVISKASFLSGGPDRFSRVSRLRALVDQELRGPNGHLLSALAKALRKLAPEFQNVTVQETLELMAWWRGQTTRPGTSVQAGAGLPSSALRSEHVVSEVQQIESESGFARALRNCTPLVQSLYEALRVHVLSLGDEVSVRETKYYAAFTKHGKNFVGVEPRKRKLTLYLHIPFDSVDLEPGFTRDVRSIGHHAPGHLEVTLASMGDLDRAKPLIERSYAAR